MHYPGRLKSQVPEVRFHEAAQRNPAQLLAEAAVRSALEYLLALSKMPKEFL